MNRERASEERSGVIRWLRPAFQNPERITQEVLATGEGQTAQSATAATAKIKWPSTLAEQAKTVREALIAENRTVTAPDLVKAFTGARPDRVADLLETLASLGQARRLEDGRYTA